MRYMGKKVRHRAEWQYYLVRVQRLPDEDAEREMYQ